MNCFRDTEERVKPSNQVFQDEVSGESRIDEPGLACFIPCIEIHDLHQPSGRSMGQALPPYLWNISTAKS